MDSDPTRLQRTRSATMQQAGNLAYELQLARLAASKLELTLEE